MCTKFSQYNIKTNFANNIKIGKRVDNSSSNNNINPNSSYSEITRNRIAGFRPRFESGSSPTEVAQIILKCVTSKNSDLRYLAGDDAIKLMDIRKNTSDKDFRKLVMDSVIHYEKKQ